MSDTQNPYHHEKALAFAAYLKRHYRIPDENCYHVGDETDSFWGGMWPKSIETKHTALQELAAMRESIAEWYAVFQKMKLAESNHGLRWKRKALAAEIPSQLLIRYRDLLQAPEGWVWKKHWRVDCKFPFIVEHGDDHGGQTPHISALMTNGMSTVIGHHHSKAGTHFVKTNGFTGWGMAVGALIDFDAHAFDYARNAKLKPVLGCGVVVDDGRVPIFIPLE